MGVGSHLTPDDLHVAIRLIRRTSVQPIENVERIAAVTLARFFHCHDFGHSLGICLAAMSRGPFPNDNQRSKSPFGQLVRTGYS